MTLRLTPETLAAAYEYLRSTPPFSGWNLPPATGIKFHVTRSKKYRALFLYDKKNPGGPHDIYVSSKDVGHTGTLMPLMAHEMIHVYQRVAGTSRHDVMHNAEFGRLLKRVCRIHGFDHLWFS